MTDKVVLLVGPRSNKKITHGMSIAFDMLIYGMKAEGITVKIINRSFAEQHRKIGTLTILGIFTNFIILVQFLWKIVFIHTVYITLGTSRAGFFRDAMMIWAASILKKRIVLHLHGGGYKDFFHTSPVGLRRMIRFMFNKVDIFIVLGDLLRDQFEFVNDIDLKIRVVPNGLPSENLNDSSPKKISNKEPLRILYLSNLIPSKGYLDVLESCRILFYDQHIPIRGDFCGAFVKQILKKVKYYRTKRVSGI